VARGGADPVSAPEDALDRARAAAAEMRAAGAYSEARATRPGPPPPEAAELKLYQWALIDPDVRQVRSTRRFGAPLTALKRLLLRLLVQYHLQLISEQTRFNVMLLGYVRRLESRIEELEARLPPEPGGDS
jgi:hypothetical protein